VRCKAIDNGRERLLRILPLNGKNDKDANWSPSNNETNSLAQEAHTSWLGDFLELINATTQIKNKPSQETV
jgi:hypothetical protein